VPPESVIRRYIKVKALALGGAPGERDNAITILAAMEARHHGLREAANKYVRERARQRTAPPPSPPPKRRVHFEDILGGFAGFARGFSDFAEGIGNVVDGRRLAREVRVALRASNKSDSLILQFKIPQSTLTDAVELNPFQFQGFKEGLHAKLDEVLEEIFFDDEAEQSD